MQPSPTVGRTVHYHPPQDPDCTVPWAALVTAVNPRGLHEADGSISASVYLPSGTAAGYPLIPFSESPKPGHWSWPPRA